MRLIGFGETALECLGRERGRLPLGACPRARSAAHRRNRPCGARPNEAGRPRKPWSSSGRPQKSRIRRGRRGSSRAVDREATDRSSRVGRDATKATRAPVFAGVLTEESPAWQLELYLVATVGASNLTYVRGGDAHAARRRLDGEPRAGARVLRRRPGRDGARSAEERGHRVVSVRTGDPADVRRAGGALRDDDPLGAPGHANQGAAS